ncbi:hypothetical protein GCM10027589_02890 [Actinocorallia lasiicapitis]
MFFGQRGGHITDRAYLAVWKKARADGLTSKEAASPLARRPYDLRHAAVSTWLAAGVPAAQVAVWAGHSVAVLLKVYAKCVSSQGTHLPSHSRRRSRLLKHGHALGTEARRRPLTGVDSQAERERPAAWIPRSAGLLQGVAAGGFEPP